jgi:hypothetical protein
MGKLTGYSAAFALAGTLGCAHTYEINRSFRIGGRETDHMQSTIRLKDSAVKNLPAHTEQSYLVAQCELPKVPVPHVRSAGIPNQPGAESVFGGSLPLPGPVFIVAGDSARTSVTDNAVVVKTEREQWTIEDGICDIRVETSSVDFDKASRKVHVVQDMKSLPMDVACFGLDLGQYQSVHAVSGFSRLSSKGSPNSMTLMTNGGQVSCTLKLHQ